jgi:hypothetical protein
MDLPSPAVSHEALQHQAYLLWEAAGFPPDRSEDFWLMAEQQLLPAERAPASEAAPIHPTRQKPAARKSPAKSASKDAAKPAKLPAKPSAKSPPKTSPAPTETPPRSARKKAPASKTPAKKRTPKGGDYS